jgi:hypothetical protein
LRARSSVCGRVNGRQELIRERRLPAKISDGRLCEGDAQKLADRRRVRVDEAVDERSAWQRDLSALPRIRSILSAGDPGL